MFLLNSSIMLLHGYFYFLIVLLLSYYEIIDKIIYGVWQQLLKRQSVKITKPQIFPTSGTTLTPTAADCDGTTSPSVMPGLTLSPPNSYFCDNPTSVVYPISHESITTVIGSSKTCTQTVSFYYF